jgi:hypothetical protein
MNFNRAPGHERHWVKVANEQMLSYGPAILVAAAMVLLSGRLFRLISRYAVNLFFSDQWGFNRATVFEKHSLWQMFRWQWGPHRQGAGALVAYFLEPYFYWNSRTESFLIGGLIVVCAGCALWLKVRLFRSVELSDICIPLILFTPLQVGQIFVVANWAHGPLPLLLTILYCLAWTIANLPWRYALVLTINFVTIYTGFGLFLGLLTPLAISADYFVNLKRQPHGKIYFAGGLLISVLSFCSFFVNYVVDPAVGCRPNLFQSPATYAKFVCLMFANVIAAKGIGFLPAFAGSILLACLLLALAMNCRKLRQESISFPQQLVAATLLLGSIVFSGFAAYGRSCLGLHEAQVSRYVMYLELGLLGFYISVLTIRAKYLRISALFFLTLVLANTIRIPSGDRSDMEYYRRFKTDWKACYLQYSDISFCDQQTGHWIYKDGRDETIKGRLNYLKQHRQNLYADVK